MSAPSTPIADAGKDAWSSYNARIQQRSEAKQAATERQRQHVKDNKVLKKISKIIPASWLGNGGGNGGGNAASSSSSRGKYKAAPPASGSDDATGGFGSWPGSASAAATGPPGVEKKE